MIMSPGKKAIIAIVISVLVCFTIAVAQDSEKGEIQHWTCGMHPSVKADQEGSCPICNMALVPVYAKEQSEAADVQEGDIREILHWTCGMHPSVKADQEGSCPICNMALVPVYREAHDEKTEQAELRISPDAARLARIKTTEVVRTEISKEIRASGEVAYDETRAASITARVGGRIEKLYADFTGKYFERGAKLALIYSPALVSAQKEFLLAKGTDLETAARIKLLQWGFSKDQITDLDTRGSIRENVAIHAPIGGTITHLGVLEGDYVNEGDVLFHIADLSRVWIIADIFEHELTHIHRGDEAVVAPFSSPGERLKGSVTFINPYIDSATRSAKVRIEMPNPHGMLLPGMHVTVAIASPLGGDDGAGPLAVPRSAVINTGRRTVAFVELEPGRYSLREVRIGTMTGDYYTILSGLAEGEWVVDRGSFLLDSQTQLTGEAEEIYGGALEKKSKEADAHSGHRH
jgi:Cu(I)/Ag(I) efflux system membrane fusion protein